MLQIDVGCLPMLFWVASLLLGQSYDCLNIGHVTVKDMETSTITQPQPAPLAEMKLHSPRASEIIVLYLGIYNKPKVLIRFTYAFSKPNYRDMHKMSKIIRHLVTSYFLV